MGSLTSLTKKITTTSLTNAKRSQIDRLYDTEIKGFFARFNVDGTATLNFRYRSKVIANRRPVIKIGVWPTLSADMARKTAVKWVERLSNGIEPKFEIERQRQEETAKRKQKALKKASILGTFIDTHYEAHMSRNKRGDQDVSRLKRRFANFLSMDMNELTKVHVYEAQDKAEKSVSFHTFKRDYAVLQGTLNYAVEMEVIKTNPISGVSLKRPKSVADDLMRNDFELGERRALSEQEVVGLFRGLDGYTESMKDMRRRSRLKKSNRHLPNWDEVTYVDHVVPIILFIYYTGFRNGDVLGLRWEHLNADFSQVGKVIEKIAHHGKGKMYFPLVTPCQEMIRVWWEQEGKPTEGWVFCSPRHRDQRRRLSESAMRKAWKKVKEFGGLDESLDLYTLRHNFASQHLMAGSDVQMVSKLMGHSDIQTTMSHYSHLTQSHLAETLKRAERLFNPQ
ncbi:tyrosine-type recombinase/integrase [Vreelandella sulfidaeris]